MRKRFSGEDLKELSREELYDLAQEFELAVRKNSTKEKLIEALLPFVQKAPKKAEASAKSAVKSAETTKKTAGRPAKTVAKSEKSTIPSMPAKADKPAKPATAASMPGKTAVKAANSKDSADVVTKTAKTEKSAKPAKPAVPGKDILAVTTADKPAMKDKKAATERTAVKTSKTAPARTPQKEPAKSSKTSPSPAKSSHAESTKISKASTSSANTFLKEPTSNSKIEPAKKAVRSAEKSVAPVTPAEKATAAKPVVKISAASKTNASSAKMSQDKGEAAKRPAVEKPVTVEESSTKKGRGRPPKKLEAAEKPVEVPPTKGRGRPAKALEKAAIKVVEKVAQKKTEPGVADEVSVAKKRGRPAKKAEESQVTAPADVQPASETSASDSAVKGLAHNFAKKADDAPPSKNKKGAAVLKDGVAIPVETSSRQKPSSKAEQIEKERSERHASLKTTMEVPIFQPVTGLEGPSTVSEDELTGELPLEYGETRIVMQIRDPHWAYAYWEIPQVELKRLELEVGIFEFAHSHFVLRLHNVSQGFSQEIKLSEHARNWYIYLESPQSVYQVELGMHSPTEGYTFISLSNLVQTPPDRVAGRWAAPIAPEPVATPDPEDRLGGHELIDRPEAPGIARITEPEYVYFSSVTGESIPHPGSSDLLAGQRLVPPEMPSSAEAALLPGGISSFAMPGSFAMPTSPMPSSSDWTSAGVSSFSGRPEAAEDDDIFLVAAVEVIVYGRVKVGCELTFQGNPLRVRPDGSFSLRLALPFDSGHSIDLLATDPRTRKTRTIKAAVSLKKN